MSGAKEEGRTAAGAGSQPLVSVLLPVWNGERHLAAAIDSILRQTYRNLELIVIDDGSTDGSAAIVACCADPRVKLVRNESNLGIVATLNRGLALARGEFVARMDADDVAEPDRIVRQVRRFESSPNLVALGTALTYVDDHGAITGRPGRLAVGPGVVRWRLLRGTCLYHPTLMLHRGRAGDDARYSADFLHAEDYELLLRLSRSHDLDNLPERLLRQRVHAASVSARFRDEQRDAAASALRRHVLDRYGYSLTTEEAASLIDPRACFAGQHPAVDTSGTMSDAPSGRMSVGVLLRLEQAFLASEVGLAPQERRDVRRDVAFVLWKLVAVALTEWSGGPRLGRRIATIASATLRLALRPVAALRALAWR